jgi:ankyrin repeat protein
LRAVIDAGVDLNQRDSVGKPRFFALLRWPEGLAFALEHGANIEAEEQDGYTAIMLAVAWDYWPAVDVLLAHGARIDHVDRHGGSLRDLVIQKLAWYRTYPPKPPAPPPLLALDARLR